MDHQDEYLENDLVDDLERKHSEEYNGDGSLAREVDANPNLFMDVMFDDEHPNYQPTKQVQGLVLYKFDLSKESELPSFVDWSLVLKLSLSFRSLLVS